MLRMKLPDWSTAQFCPVRLGETMLISGMMQIRIAAAAIVAGTVGIAVAAPLQVAVVEEISGDSAGVQIMDYLESGRTIKLDPDDTIMLSYMSSCMQETITGGTVTVGTHQSEVRAGKVRRIKVPCDVKMLVKEKVGPTAGSIWRGEIRPPNAPPRLYGASPLVELTAPGVLIIERTDKSGERVVVDVASEQLVRGRFYDFARWGKALAAGGSYRAVFGAQAMVFEIDPHAEPGYIPIVCRLLRFSLPTS
jgi:hypothetical protein